MRQNRACTASKTKELGKVVINRHFNHYVVYLRAWSLFFLKTKTGNIILCFEIDPNFEAAVHTITNNVDWKNSWGTPLKDWEHFHEWVEFVANDDFFDMV